MSAFGPKRTSLVAPHMSAFGGKADMTFCGAMSAFDPKRTLMVDPNRSFDAVCSNPWITAALTYRDRVRGVPCVNTGLKREARALI
jgi:hypothetical protein